jgi:hypothetical protein
MVKAAPQRKTKLSQHKNGDILAANGRQNRMNVKGVQKQKYGAVENQEMRKHIQVAEEGKPS